MGNLRVGIDIGGTFTDLAIFDDQTHDIEVLKVATTPKDLTMAVRQCFKEILKTMNRKPNEIVFVYHGTTQATNALLSRSGAKSCLFITEGFRGIYEVRDQTRELDKLFDLYFEKPPMLISQSQTFEVAERVNFRGEVVRPLDKDRLKKDLEKVRKGGYKAAAICLLFSFMNPQHEREIEELVARGCPEIEYVSASHKVLPQIREWTRLSTSVIDAYVGPVLKSYLDKIGAVLKDLGIKAQPFIMHSGGGTMTIEAAKSKAVWCIESGPAAGLIACGHLSKMAGISRSIAFDMGGTTAKAGLTINGEPQISKGFTHAGFPLGISAMDLAEVGSGGGSIAWIDPTGLLKVGPKSAQADPGPVCYKKGGTEPTVTDANLVLGYINPEYFLGGRMKIYKEPALDAIREKIAKPLGLGDVETAAGIIKIVNTNMAEAIRTVSVARGYDPRDFALIAFGSAGPLHAVSLADEIGIRKVMVPLVPGVISALGLLLTDVKHEYVLSRLRLLDETPIEEINELFSKLESEAYQELRNEGFSEDKIKITRYFDMRYSGQAYELKVEVSNTIQNDEDRKKLRKDFDLNHEQTYGTKAETEPVEIVNYRVVGYGLIPKPKFREWNGPSSGDALKGHRKVFIYSKDFVDTAVYERNLLRSGQNVQGPAIVEQSDSTTLILPGYSATIDMYGNLVISKSSTLGA